MNEEICSKCGESKQASEVVIVRRGNLNHYDHSFAPCFFLRLANTWRSRLRILLPCHRIEWEVLAAFLFPFSSVWESCDSELAPSDLETCTHTQVVVIINFNIFPINESTINWGGGRIWTRHSLQDTMLKRNQCCATWEPELHPFPKLIIPSEANENKVAWLEHTNQPTPNLILQM